MYSIVYNNSNKPMITIKPQDVTVFKDPLMMMVKLGVDEGMANYFANQT